MRSWWGNQGELQGAYGEIDGRRTRIIKTELVGERRDAPATPGTVHDRDGETLVIQCGDGPLCILRYEVESREGTTDRMIEEHPAPTHHHAP